MNNLHKLAIPVAIIIAGAFIAWGVMHSGSKAPSKSEIEDAQHKAADYIAKLDIAPVSSLDHMQGSLNAKVTIIEYSDTECPYCKVFHQTLTQIFNEYNSAPSNASTSSKPSSTATVPSIGNKVAWVYRHYPIADLHSKAPKEAEATECANELGGQALFWKYISTIFTNTPSNDALDPEDLVIFADDVGLNKDEFVTCLNSGKYATKITESIAAAERAGASATPYTVLLVKTGTKVERVPLIDADGSSLGSLPYTTMKAIIERLLNS